LRNSRAFGVSLRLHLAGLSVGIEAGPNEEGIKLSGATVADPPADELIADCDYLSEWQEFGFPNE